MPSEFEIASTLTPSSGGGSFVGQVPDGWQQGRGSFGGLVLGILARAMELHIAEPERRLRTLAGDLMGPVLPGAIEVRTKVLRRGARQTNAEARLVQGGAVLATATAVLSAPRVLDVPQLLVDPPERAEWDQVPPVDVQPPFGPHFAHAYEYRPTGPVPFGGGRDAEASGWIRERTVADRRDAPSLIALLDAWWPTLYSLESAPRPLATVSWVGELLIDPRQLDPGVRLFQNARMAALHEGFFVELRELWSGDDCVALNQQTFAVLR